MKPTKPDQVHSSSKEEERARISREFQAGKSPTDIAVENGLFTGAGSALRLRLDGAQRLA